MTGRAVLLILPACLLLSQTAPDSDARDYERFMARWTRPLAPELIRFAALTDTARLLDYGCATGPLALRLAVRYPQSEVIGVDSNPNYTAWAQLQAPRARVRFQTVPELVRLPFENGGFDATLSIGTLSSMQEAERAVAEMRRVTRPEGVVAAAVWDYGGGMQPLDLFWNAAVALNPTLVPADGAQTPFSKKGQLESLWRTVKFRDVSEQAVEVEFTYRNFDDYWSPFLLRQGTAGAWLATRSPEQQSQVREKLRARVLGSRPDGPFLLKARAWMVRGVVRMD